jgi:hypothetical protein
MLRVLVRNGAVSFLSFWLLLTISENVQARRRPISYLDTSWKANSVSVPTKRQLPGGFRNPFPSDRVGGSAWQYCCHLGSFLASPPDLTRAVIQREIAGGGKGTFRVVDRSTSVLAPRLSLSFGHLSTSLIQGYLTKYEARICARGNQDTYATALFAKSLRTASIIAVCFGLEAISGTFKTPS